MRHWHPGVQYYRPPEPKLAPSWADIGTLTTSSPFRILSWLRLWTRWNGERSKGTERDLMPGMKRKLLSRTERNHLPTPSRPSPSCPVPLHAVPSFSMPSRPLHVILSLHMQSRPPPHSLVPLRPVPSLFMPFCPSPPRSVPLYPVPSLFTPSSPSLYCSVPLWPFPSLSTPFRLSQCRPVSLYPSLSILSRSFPPRPVPLRPVPSVTRQRLRTCREAIFSRNIDRFRDFRKSLDMYIYHSRYARMTAGVFTNCNRSPPGAGVFRFTKLT